MTIASELTTLASTKSAIATAITGKGQDLTGVPFSGYAAKIDAISSGGGVVTYFDEAYHASVVSSVLDDIPSSLLSANPFVGTTYGVYHIVEIPNGQKTYVVGIESINAEVNINWGDGSSIENFATVSSVEHIYDLSNISTFASYNSATDSYYFAISISFVGNPTIMKLNPNSAMLTSFPYRYSNNCATFANLNTSFSSMGFRDATKYLSVKDSYAGNSSYYDIVDGLKQLKAVDIDSPEGFYRNYHYAFSGSNYLESVKGVRVNNLSYAFQSCTALKQVELLSVANNTSCNNAFYGCRSIETIPNFGAAQNLSFYEAFKLCPSINDISGLTGCSAINIGNLMCDSGNILDFSCFSVAGNITAMPWDYQYSAGFYGVGVDQDAVIFPTGFSELQKYLVKSWSHASTFSASSSYNPINYYPFGGVVSNLLNSNLDFSNVKNPALYLGNSYISEIILSNMSTWTYNLSSGVKVMSTYLTYIELTGFTGKVDLISCSRLSVDGAVALFNSLGNPAGAYVIALNTSSPASLNLTVEQRQIALDKGWTITG